MFSKLLLFTERRICQQLHRGISASPSWDIVTSVCIERLPVVTPPLNEMQKKYMNLIKELEVENSLKSDHELRHENDKLQVELLKNESVDADTVSKVTAQDFEDANTEELANFKFADIVTDADKKGDKTSLERCLQKHLVLVSDVKVGENIKTILPQANWKEGETLRQTAERIVKDEFGSELKVQFLGNAPCGFYKYKYPKEMDGKVGAKVFFYYANYKGGEIKSKSNIQWLTRAELDQSLPARYNKSVSEFLIEETY